MCLTTKDCTIGREGALVRGGHRGVTMVEVLVALLVLSIGLLGLAGLQAASLQANHTAFSRSQATMLSYEIIDRMRANRDSARWGNYDIALDDDDPSGNTVAEQDVRGWRVALRATLPDASGAIEVDNSTSAVTVRTQWDQGRVDASLRGGAERSEEMVEFTVESRL